MDLKDRILKVMASERLSASVFADRIGVQRSSISHILSGRNKPSLEFLQKIINSFPKYSLDWLIMDQGDMLKDSPNSPNIPNSPTKPQNLNKERVVEQEPISTNITIDNKQSTLNVPAETLNPTKNTDIGNTINTINTSKTVEKVVIFYTDKTFDSYNPNDS